MTTMAEHAGTTAGTSGTTTSTAATAAATPAGGTAASAAAAPAASIAPNVPAPPTAPATPPVPVWRNRRLQTLNLGAFAALTGVGIADLVYPLLVLGFTGKPILAGLFGAIQFATMVVVSLPAGVIVDRHDRRHILITSELVRALTATVLAISLAAGHVWLAEVYLVAVVLGASQPFSGIRTLAVRGVVPPEQVTSALSTQQVFSGMAALIGPAVGALMFTASRSLPFTVIAAGMTLSAAAAYLVRFDSRPATRAKTGATDGPANGAVNGPTEGVTDGAEHVESDEHTAHAERPESNEADEQGLLAGLRIIWGSAVMRSTMLFIMMLNLIGVPLDLVIILEARHQGVPTRYLGAILAAFAVGGVIGAPLVPRVHALMRPGQVLATFGLICAAVLALLAVPFGGFWMAGCMLTVGLLLPAVEILVNVLILHQVPDHQRGRVLSAVMTFMGLGMPLGAAFGGSLLQVLSPTTVLFGASGVLTCVTLIAIAQRDLRTAQWPGAAGQK
jgi:MFS family permease